MGYQDRGPRRSNFGPQQSHKITCSACGAEATVPFEPKGDRPVFCRECYQKQKGR